MSTSDVDNSHVSRVEKEEADHPSTSGQSAKWILLTRGSRGSSDEDEVEPSRTNAPDRSRVQCWRERQRPTLPSSCLCCVACPRGRRRRNQEELEVVHVDDEQRRE